MIIQIEPYLERLQEYHTKNISGVEFYDWLKQEYGAYQVYTKSNPSAHGNEAIGLRFFDEADATYFTLKWS